MNTLMRRFVVGPTSLAGNVYVLASVNAVYLPVIGCSMVTRGIRIFGSFWSWTGVVRV